VITIYHNSRCQKSREAHKLLEESGLPFLVHFYLENPLNEAQIKALLAKLNIAPLQLIRTGEAIWKENYKGKVVSDSDIVKAMATHPKLIERPLLESQTAAIIGRPIQNVHTFLSSDKD
jgi:arsenate reductase